MRHRQTGRLARRPAARAYGKRRSAPSPARQRLPRRGYASSRAASSRREGRCRCHAGPSAWATATVVPVPLNGSRTTAGVVGAVGSGQAPAPCPVMLWDNPAAAQGRATHPPVSTWKQVASRRSRDVGAVRGSSAPVPVGAGASGICQPVWGTDLHLLLSGGLLRLALVDPGRSGRAGRRRRLVDEPFGVGGVRRVKDAGPFGVDGLGAPVVHVGRDVQPQTGVPVLVVVPAEEGLTVHASRFDRGEAGGEV